jgi:hypothetical protein
MAEIASPASDPRSLRRHYPHQVQGVVQLDLSAIAAPPHFYLIQNKTPLREVNAHAAYFGRTAKVFGESASPQSDCG